MLRQRGLVTLSSQAKTASPSSTAVDVVFSGVNGGALFLSSARGFGVRGNVTSYADYLKKWITSSGAQPSSTYALNQKSKHSFQSVSVGDEATQGIIYSHSSTGAGGGSGGGSSVRRFTRPAMIPSSYYSPSASSLVVQRANFGKDKDDGSKKLANEAEPSVSSWEVVDVVAKNLWPKGRWDLRLRVLVSFSFVFATKLLKVSVPFWFKSVVDSLVPGTAASAAVTIGPVTLGIFAMVAAYGITRLVASMTDEAKSVIFTPVASNAANRIGMGIFDKLHQKDLTYHLSKQTGSLSRDMDRGSRAFSLVTFDIFFALGPTAIEMALVCYMLQTQAGIHLVATAALAVGLYFAWTFAVTSWRAKFRQEYNEIDTKVGGMVIDSLMNYETVKYFGAEKHESKRVLDQYLKMNKAVLKLDASMSLMNFGQQAIFIGAATAGLYLGASSVLAGTMTVGDMVLVDALLLQLYQPLQFLGIVYRELTTSTQNMEKMLTLLKSDIKIRNDETKALLEYQKGTIEFKNVSFQYDSSRPILKNVNLTIPGGTTAAFVGPSGSGKTTIFRLVFRFFDPNEGTILIDGQDIKDRQLDSVRHQIAMVPQDTVMFNDTIRENIAYGDINGNPSVEKIEDAAKKAHLHNSICTFADKYETVVGERGLMLSGGEKQRLAIARVILRGSPILLADEATSALDTKTEESVLKTLNEGDGQQVKKKTVIMIAHRLTTIQSVDTIFVLDGKGSLVQQGSHEELLAQEGGLYHQLWMRQIKDQTI